MEKINELTQLYRALGDETRLRLIKLLAAQKPSRARCVTSLAKALGTSTSNISQHLRVLKDLDLVKAKRRSYRLHYFLNLERFSALAQLQAAIFGDLLNPLTTLMPIEKYSEIRKDHYD